MLELAVIRFYDEIRSFINSRESEQTMDLHVESETYFKEGRGGEAAKNKTLRYWPM